MVCPDGGIGRRARFRCEWTTSLEVRVFFRAFFVILLFSCLLQAKDFSITAGVVDFSYKKMTCTLSRNAKLMYNTQEFNADEIVIVFTDNTYTNVKQAHAYGNIEFKHENIVVHSQKCYTDGDNIVFAVNVTITHPLVGQIFAQTAKYNISKKHVTISPHVRIVVNVDKNDQ